MRSKSGWVISLLLAVILLAVGNLCSAEQKVLRFSSWNNEGDYPAVFEIVAQRFEKDYPDYKVEIVWIPWANYNAKTKAAIAAGDPYEITEVHPGAWNYSLAKAGVLRPLTNEKGFPDFYEPIVADLTFFGEQWTVPMDVNNLIVAYNKTIFDRFGLSIPRTQDELVDICKKLKEDNIYGIALGNKNFWTGGDVWFQMMVYADPTHKLVREADNGKVSFEKPEFVEAARKIVELVNKGVFVPGINGMDYYTGAFGFFAREKAAMFYPAGTWIVGGIDRGLPEGTEWGMFPFPAISSDQEPTATGGPATNWAVPAQANYQDAAIELLRYLCDDETKKTLLKYKMIPSSPLTFELEIKDPIFKAMFDAQATAQTRWIFHTPIYERLTHAIQGLIDGELTPEQFYADVEKVSQSIER